MLPLAGFFIWQAALFINWQYFNSYSLICILFSPICCLQLPHVYSSVVLHNHLAASVSMACAEKDATVVGRVDFVAKSAMKLGLNAPIAAGRKLPVTTECGNLNGSMAVESKMLWLPRSNLRSRSKPAIVERGIMLRQESQDLQKHPGPERISILSTSSRNMIFLKMK